MLKEKWEKLQEENGGYDHVHPSIKSSRIKKGYNDKI